VSRYRPYPQYKDSGVEWLGTIPDNWDIAKVKHFFYLGRGRVIAQEEMEDKGLFPVYSSQTKNNGIMGYVSTYDFDCKQITWTTDGANAGTVFLREGQHNCTNVCGTLQPKNNNENLEYITYSLQYATQFYKRPDTNGAKIMNGEMAEIFFTFPSPEEQQSIANFLDNATCKIDTLIQKQQNLIELLKEKRQALISHTVTKGLNPHVKMKDSGVEWLGEVPEHWEVKRVKFLFKIRKRIVGKEGYDVLSITQQGIKVKDIESNEGQLSMDYSKYQFANIGDFAMNHMDLLTGYVDISSFNGVISPDYRVFTLEDKNSFSKFYLYIFQNGYKNKIFYKFGQGSSQVGRWRLPTDEFNDFVFPYPSFIEQQEIANYLDNATCKIDTLISKSQKAIELLKERRTALISATVTGKIDVRETA